MRYVKCIVTVVGKDRVGIIAKTSTYLAEIAKTMDRAAARVGVNFIGGYTALDQTQCVCSSEKYHSGGLWANTCCSHPRKGEVLEEAVHRRMMEEVGFDCPVDDAGRSEERPGRTFAEICCLVSDRISRRTGTSPGS